MKLSQWGWTAGGAVALLLLARSASDSDAVVAKLPGLSASQRAAAAAAARVIRSEVDGCTDNLVIAALANAMRESQLNPNAKGDGASGTYHSFGLFQCNVYGAGAGWDPQDLLDPAQNAQAICDVVNSSFGRALLAQMRSGASAQDLARTWCEDIERPANKPVQSAKSAAIVASWFGNV